MLISVQKLGLAVITVAARSAASSKLVRVLPRISISCNVFYLLDNFDGKKNLEVLNWVEKIKIDGDPRWE
jgi:hypothetical protein